MRRKTFYLIQNYDTKEYIFHQNKWINYDDYVSGCYGWAQVIYSRKKLDKEIKKLPDITGFWVSRIMRFRKGIFSSKFYDIQGNRLKRIKE